MSKTTTIFVCFWHLFRDSHDIGNTYQTGKDCPLTFLRFCHHTTCSQCPHGIEDSKDGDTYISEDRHPHGGKAECGKQQHRHFDTDGKPHILTGLSETYTKVLFRMYFKLYFIRNTKKIMVSETLYLHVRKDNIIFAMKIYTTVLWLTIVSLAANMSSIF